VSAGVGTPAWFPPRSVSQQTAKEKATSQPRAARLSISKENAVGIEVRNLSKKYGSFQAVNDVSFEVPGGQLVAL
jgi:ABC-type uncharacterized transport system ATPase subunit